MPVAPEGRARGGGADTAADPEESIREIWRRYQHERSESLRNCLIAHYMPRHVRRLAERLHASLPQQVDVDDLMQQGYLGLVDAIERYELDRNVRFETFSARRIFGAMRDYLRDIDPMPRLARARAKSLEAASEDYFKRHGQRPSDDVLLRRLQLPTHKFRQLLATGRATMVSYHADPDPADDSDALDALQDKQQPGPLRLAERDDLRRWVTHGFCRRDHLIIVLYYYEQMTMREVGGVLGISESRVSQRLESILKCLRSRMCLRTAALEFAG